MCDWIRDPARQPDGASQQPSGPPRSFIRPRVVGAVAAGMLAAVATAAMLMPANPTAAPEDTSALRLAPAAVVPLAPAAGETPVAAAPQAIEQTATTLDDGVPSSAEVARSKVGGGPCSHEL